MAREKSIWKLIKTLGVKAFALLDGVEDVLEDDIDELMNDSDTELVFEKKDCEEESQGNRADVPETKEKPKGSEREKRSLRRLKLPWISGKRLHHTDRDNLIFLPRWLILFLENHTPSDVFPVVTVLNPLLKLLVTHSFSWQSCTL